MPKNTQGGNKHKKYSNKVSGTTKKNKKAFDDLLSDLRSKESTAGVEVGRVVKPVGSGNFEVFYYSEKRKHTVTARLRGSMKGKKHDVFVGPGAYVLLGISEELDSGATAHITAVITLKQAQQLRDEDSSMDLRIFDADPSIATTTPAAGAGGGGGAAGAEAGVIFEESDDSDSEIDIDNM
jgi:translation initiation factor IF-1